MMARPRIQTASGAVALSALLAALMLPGGAPSTAAIAELCGTTTLQATIRARPDGTLECGPGESLVTREDLAKAKPERASVRDAIVAFLSLADFQLADEESPLRREWADACGDVATASAFRPHETLLAHVINAHVRAASALATAGSPALGTPYSFAVQLGDAADNQQYDEVRWFIDLLDGNTMVDPNSGGEGYEGVQGADPQGGTPGLPSPVAGVRIRDLANEPFWAHGLRTASGAPIPWYSVAGNHDVKVQGTLPDDNLAWRSFARAWVTGRLKVQHLGPDHLQRVCEDPTVLLDPLFWTAVATSPGSTRLVTPDPDRRLLDREQWMQEHFTTGGLPAGHGFAPSNRCRDAAGALLGRACYSFNQGAVHVIALDTNPAEGMTEGNIDAAQFAWLERDLIANSSRYYDAQGTAVQTDNTDRLVVVLSHHTTMTTTNTAAAPGQTAYTGKDLEALLLRFPNVVLHANGHTHANAIWPHEGEHAAYWEVNTASVADWPTQSRSIEIADNHDGTLSIIGVVFDAAVPPNPRSIAWAADDLTDETGLGDAPRRVNEDWLASLAREVAWNDPQRPAGNEGSAQDRNVELLLPHPFGVTSAGTFVPPPEPGPIGFGPGFQPDFPGFDPGLLDGFPPGFPGVPDRPTGGFVPPPPAPESVTTHRGLGAPSTAGTGWEARAGLLLLASIAGASWLTQARVRRWMVGI